MRQLISRVFIFSLFTLFLFCLFCLSTLASKPLSEDKNTLLLHTPVAVLSFSFQLWYELLTNELHQPYKEPATRLRLKKNLDQMERVLKQANQRYLTLLQEQLPQSTEIHWGSLIKKHTAWLSLLEDISSLILQGETPSQDLRKRLLTSARSPSLPSIAKQNFTPKQEEILLEAIEIFATSNEMYGYYYVKQRMLCASSSSSSSSSDPLLMYSLQQQRFFRALQKQTKQASLASYIYHNALLSRALFLLPTWCHRPTDKKEIHERSKKILLQTMDILQKSLTKQSKSFSSLWQQADAASPKGHR